MSLIYMEINQNGRYEVFFSLKVYFLENIKDINNFLHTRKGHVYLTFSR